MNAYELRIRRNGDFYNDAYAVYADREFNRPYLEASIGFYDTDFHVVLEDDANGIAFDIR